MIRHRLPTIVVVSTLLAGCGGAAERAEPAGGPAVTKRTAPPETGPPESAARLKSPGSTPPDVPAEGTPGDAATLVTDLDLPWGAATLPDGSMLVSLRDEARVISVAAGGATTDVSATGQDGRVAGVRPDGEGGLLGLAVAPGATTADTWVYAYLTAADDNRVVRMPLRDGVLGAQQAVLTGIPKASSHNGGQLAFGPDGMLYISTGDANRTAASQQLDDLGGKILRVLPDGGVPDDNPFPGNPVWSLGHRNVQGLGWAPNGTMYASEFGQDTYDELNRIEAGGNYGWPEVEGPGDGDGDFVAPIATWATEDASPSGLAVTGDAVYLAALRGQRLWRVPLNGSGDVGKPQSFYQGEFGRLRSVTSVGGGLRLLTSNGEGSDRIIDVDLVTDRA